MKSILMSIKPKWVEKIASGEKTVEVRKTVPKCGTPFKVYMYMTKESKRRFYDDRFNSSMKGDSHHTDMGKVVGEFVCDRITELESEFWDDETYESIGEVWYDQDDGEREVSIFADNDFKDNKLCMKSCVSWEELREYIGIGIKTFYGLHISDLKIYDTPKELSQFWTIKCNHRKTSCGECDYKPNCIKDIDRPPQSWCYVEEL